METLEDAEMDDLEGRFNGGRRLLADLGVSDAGVDLGGRLLFDAFSAFR